MPCLPSHEDHADMNWAIRLRKVESLSHCALCSMAVILLVAVWMLDLIVYVLMSTSTGMSMLYIWP